MDEKEWESLKTELSMIADGYPEVSVSTAPRLPPPHGYPPFLLAAVMLKEKWPADGQGQRAETEDEASSTALHHRKEPDMHYLELFESNPPEDGQFITDLMAALGKDNLYEAEFTMNDSRGVFLCSEASFAYCPQTAGMGIHIFASFEKKKTAFVSREAGLNVEISGALMLGRYAAAIAKMMYRQLMGSERRKK